MCGKRRKRLRNSSVQAGYEYESVQISLDIEKKSKDSPRKSEHMSKLVGKMLDVGEETMYNDCYRHIIYSHWVEERDLSHAMSMAWL